MKGGRRNLISPDAAPSSSHEEGSGAGSQQFRRDEIQKKPEAPVSNNKEEQLDAGAVKSKVVEQSPEDPGDRRKVFYTEPEHFKTLFRFIYSCFSSQSNIPCNNK